MTNLLLTARMASTRLAKRGLLLGALVLPMLGAGLVLPAAPAEAAQQVSKDFFEKFKPAQDALQKRDYATALRAAKEAAAVAKNNEEREYALKVQLSAAFGAQRWADATEAGDALLAMGSVSAAEKANYRRSLGQVYEQQRQYAKAISYTQEAMKSGATARDHELLFRVYSIQGDCSNAMASLDRAIGNKPATEAQLKARNSCLFKAGNSARRQPVAEELLRRFPKKAYFTDVLGLYQEQKLDPRAMLNLYRLGFEKDLLEREVDYTAYADLAASAGNSSEANRALERGVAKGVIKKGDPNSRTARLLVSSAKIASDDRAKLPQLDKEARAGRNGESDVVVGASYYGLGEYAKAAEAIRRGLQADRVGRVKRPDDAQMLLGIALLKSGKKGEAEKAFQAAAADPKMAKAAELWKALS